MDCNWTILFIGGCSGVGKTTVSKELARRFSCARVETDDLKVALQSTTTRLCNPALFRLVDDPNFRDTLDEFDYCKVQLSISDIVWPSIQELAKKYHRLKERVIFEGDLLLPSNYTSLLLPDTKAIWLFDDLDRIRSKQQQRSRPGNPTQHANVDARFSFTYGQELRKQVQRYECKSIEVSNAVDPLEQVQRIICYG